MWPVCDSLLPAKAKHNSVWSEMDEAWNYDMAVTKLRLFLINCIIRMDCGEERSNILILAEVQRYSILPNCKDQSLRFQTVYHIQTHTINLQNMHQIVHEFDHLIYGWRRQIRPHGKPLKKDLKQFTSHELQPPFQDIWQVFGTVNSLPKNYLQNTVYPLHWVFI